MFMFEVAAETIKDAETLFQIGLGGLGKRGVELQGGLYVCLKPYRCVYMCV